MNDQVKFEQVAKEGTERNAKLVAEYSERVQRVTRFLRSTGKLTEHQVLWAQSILQGLA